MSSILKALKKLEDDKLHQKQKQLGIDARILHDEPNNRMSRSAVSLIAFTLFVCGCGATYFFMKDDPAKGSIPLAKSAEKNNLPTVSAAATPALLSSGTVQAASHLLSSEFKQVSRRSQTRSSSRDAMPQLTKTSQTRLVEKPVIISPQPESPPLPSSIATTSIGSRPVLTINGIAFQEGGSDNLAVINGVTVTSGTMIEGVKVEEIQKDRVRFSHDGDIFEIVLNKSNK